MVRDTGTESNSVDAPPGPCVEGMECQQTDEYSRQTDFDCICRGGTWSCSSWPPNVPLGQGLPMRDPDPSQRCPGTLPKVGINVACSLPEHCGTICHCTVGSNWACVTVRGIQDDGGERVSSEVPDAEVSAYPDAGCAWPPCSLLQPSPAACSDGGPQCMLVRCNVPVCSSSGDLGPLGSCIFEQ